MSAVIRRGKQLLGGLNAAFGPAVLLAFEGVDFGGQFGGAGDPRQEAEVPAGELGAVAQVDVFGEGVVLPAAGFFDGGGPPQAGGAVEVDPRAAAVAGGVLDHEVPVEEDGLPAGEQAVGAVEVAPARLHHAQLGVGEVVDGALEKVGGRHEVGVEDGDQFTFGRGHTCGQGAGLVAGAVGAVHAVRYRRRAHASGRRGAGRSVRCRRSSRRAPEPADDRRGTG